MYVQKREREREKMTEAGKRRLRGVCELRWWCEESSLFLSTAGRARTHVPILSEFFFCYPSPGRQKKKIKKMAMCHCLSPFSQDVGVSARYGRTTRPLVPSTVGWDANVGKTGLTYDGQGITAASCASCASCPGRLRGNRPSWSDLLCSALLCVWPALQQPHGPVAKTNEPSSVGRHISGPQTDLGRNETAHARLRPSHPPAVRRIGFGGYHQHIAPRPALQADWTQLFRPAFSIEAHGQDSALSRLMGGKKGKNKKKKKEAIPLCVAELSRTLDRCSQPGTAAGTEIFS